MTGLIVGVPCLRLKGDYLAIATLGFSEIIRVVLQNMDSVGASRGFTGIPSYTNFFWTFFVASTAAYVVVNLVNSTYGRGFLAVRDDEVAAEAMGINTTRYKVTAFVIGAFFAGIAGGLYAHFKQFLVPEGFNFMKSIEIVVMVTLGGVVGSFLAALANRLYRHFGRLPPPERLNLVRTCEAAVIMVLGNMGNVIGVVLAAVVLTVLPEVLRKFAEYRMILYSLLLIVLMLTCPQGAAQMWQAPPNFWKRKRP